ncbi:MAG: Fe(3+) ABC transporter substrate-binding protein [Paracoccaceae bacterium]
MKFILRSAFGMILTACAIAPAMSDTVIVYSHRQPYLIEPLLDAFTEKTGIKTKVLYSDKGLAQRLKSEGRNSPADLVLTVDIARLSTYDRMGLLAETSSDVLEANIPAHLRSDDNTWFGLSKRSRIIVTSKKRVPLGEIMRVEDLAKPEWNGRICTRPGSHVYNRALMASLIAHHGEDEAKRWATNLVNNLARKPQGNDRAQVKAIFEGVCDVAIINNYYYGKMKYSDETAQHDWAKAINIVFPNQGEEDRGAHINLSGAGIAKYSKNKEAALRLLEFLSAPEAQSLYAEINFEYPVNPLGEVSDELKSWGAFKEDQLPIETIAKLSKPAQFIINETGW